MSNAPLCFILMPFGIKPDGVGGTIDFDAVYAQIIEVAVRDAGLEPVRADQEQVGGIIHKPMFERLILCDVAVADLTTANANVFYELGVRHAIRPFTTVPIFAEGQRLPFDITLLRCLPYRLDGGRPKDAVGDSAKLAQYLRAALQATHAAIVDSPVYQLVPDLRRPEIDHLRTDVFRDRARYAEDLRERLSKARTMAKEAANVRGNEERKAALMREALVAVDTVRDEVLLRPGGAEAGVLVDLLLTYRALGTKDGCRRMISLVEVMPEELKRTILVQEQYGFALNRSGRGDDAERALRALIAAHGPSSETCGLLGRVRKDRWDAARKAGDEVLAAGLLEQAIATYLQGFEADWRDAYPGINAVTLMEIAGDERRHALVPVVRFAVERKLACGEGDYWDQATLLELAVLGQDEPRARRTLMKALALQREPWEAGTTANNLRLIREARSARGVLVGWADAIEGELVKRAG